MDQSGLEAGLRRSRLLRILEHRATAWVLLAAALLVTAWAWRVSSTFVQQRSAERFKDRTQEISQVIAQRLVAYESILRCGAGLFSASGEVSRAEWRDFVASTRLQEKFPGIQGLGFTLMLAPQDLAAHTQAIRAEGFPAYALRPAGERTQYSSIIYLEPFDERNQRAFGYDMYAEPVRRAAMDAARDSGDVSVSGMVTLVQETDKNVQHGFLMYMPVYRHGQPTATVAERRAALQGFVYSPFRVKNLMQGILGRRRPDLSFVLYDAAGVDEQHQLYASQEGAASPPDGPQRILPLLIAGGRPWTLAFLAEPDYLDLADRSLPLIVALGGAVISLLLFTLVVFLSRQAKRVRRLAEDMTREIRESQVRWSFAMEVIGDGMWDWDIPGKAIRYEPRYEEMLGYRPGEIGQAPEEFAACLHPDDRNLVLASVARHLGGETPAYSAVHRTLRKDGSWMWVLCRGKVLSRDAQGQPLHFIGTSSDLTERRRAEAVLREKQDQIALLLDSTAEGIYGIDMHGRCSYCNAACLRLLGYERADQLIGQDMHELIHHKRTDGTHFPVEDCRIFQAFQLGQGTHADDEVLWRADGSAFQAEYWSHPQRRDDTIVGAVVTFIDITGRKRAFAELHAAKLAAEAAAQAKSSFLANMSHEIRTPMNGILGMTELLLGTPLNAEQEDFARTAYRSAEALLTLLNDILDFSKIDAGKLDLESVPFDPRQLVYDVIELFRPRVAGSAVELLARIAPNLPGRVLGDPGRWRQILTNLVGNAIKFTAKGHVLVDLDWHDGAFVLAVSDTGIGIPPDRLALLFQPFVQADSSTSRRFGGTGLGLVISRRIAELMHGTLEVHTVEGQGSTFTARLPLPLATSPAPETALPSLLGRRILVVDDSEVNCRIVGEQVTILGGQAELRSSPLEALAAIRAAADAGTPYDAAVIDLHMPVLDGAGLAAAIRVEPVNATLPLILLTSSGVRGDAQRMSDIGFTGYLVKPARIEVLGAIIATAIEHRRLGLPGLVTRHSLREGGAGQDQPRPLLKGTSRILLVEDNPVNQKLARIMLSRLGAGVTIAGNGQEALDLLQHETFDLVFMDCQMPVMDGYEATAALRAREARSGSARLPIIAMTANAMSGDRERSLAAGMDDHLAKPVQERQIAGVLQRWLGGGGGAGGERRAVLDQPGASADAIFDPGPLRELAAADPEAFRDVLALIRADLQLAPTTLPGLLASGEQTALAMAGHRLKGSAGSVGGTALALACGRLERVAGAADPAASRAAVEAVLQAIAQLGPRLEGLG